MNKFISNKIKNQLLVIQLIIQKILIKKKLKLKENYNNINQTQLKCKK